MPARNSTIQLLRKRQPSTISLTALEGRGRGVQEEIVEGYTDEWLVKIAVCDVNPTSENL